jgi:pyruvate/2-oxoglutarate dehydrogenase complex dihydrolipoamide acyltransferase (E2) component
VLHCRLLAPSLSVGVAIAALLFAGAAAADPIPDGAAPGLDAPVAVAPPSAAAEAPAAPRAAPAVKAPSASASRSRTAAREPLHCPPGRRGAKTSAGACADPDSVFGVAVKKIHSGPHLEVVARDLRLDDTSRERLERIAQRYFEATRSRLVVTGGTRTPERQAELMLEKLAHGEDIVALYENKAAVTEIRAVYRESAGVRQPKKQLIHALRDVITAQMDKGIYVSRHLKAGAADVRSRGLKAPQEAAFRRAVADEPGVILIDERSSAEPHLHLGL